MFFSYFRYLFLLLILFRETVAFVISVFDVCQIQLRAKWIACAENSFSIDHVCMPNQCAIQTEISMEKHCGNFHCMPPELHIKQATTEVGGTKLKFNKPTSQFADIYIANVFAYGFLVYPKLLLSIHQQLLHIQYTFYCVINSMFNANCYSIFYSSLGLRFLFRMQIVQKKIEEKSYRNHRVNAVWRDSGGNWNIPTRITAETRKIAPIDRAF